MIPEHAISRFPNSNLLDWYDRVKRDLPWRETKDPYPIWISEIVLQQTRVDQGLPYFERFIARFPTVKSLAEAPEDDVLKHWEGLGYYSRARNLHFTAKFIQNELGGNFPTTHSEILKLKGIGPYTAAAIGSIAFNLPVAAVDGNVYRVLSRYFGITDSIDETPAKKTISELANRIISATRPGDHNQAVMELGATVCVPANPTCGECPLHESCIALRDDLQAELPVRTKKTKVRERFFHYIVKIYDGNVLIQRRGAGDIWQGLYEFPMIETEHRSDSRTVLNQLGLKDSETVVSISEEFKHILSHQRIFANFYLIKTEALQGENFLSVGIEELGSFAFPRLINRYLEKNSLVIDREV